MVLSNKELTENTEQEGVENRGVDAACAVWITSVVESSNIRFESSLMEVSYAPARYPISTVIIGVMIESKRALGHFRWRSQKGIGTANPIKIDIGTIWSSTSYYSWEKERSNKAHPITPRRGIKLFSKSTPRDTAVL